MVNSSLKGLSKVKRCISDIYNVILSIFYFNYCAILSVTFSVYYMITMRGHTPIGVQFSLSWTSYFALWYM